MEVTGYQTLEDRDNIDEIEFDGPFKCTRSDARLGHGYYFWDSNLEWAISWGKNSYNKRGKEFIIGSCIIDLDQDCFDLYGSVECQQLLQGIKDEFIRSGLINKQKKLILPTIIEYMKQQNIFPYKSIRAGDNNNPIKFYFHKERNEFTMVNQRVQICVIEKHDVILSFFNVIFPK